VLATVYATVRGVFATWRYDGVGAKLEYKQYYKKVLGVLPCAMLDGQYEVQVLFSAVVSIKTMESRASPALSRDSRLFSPATSPLRSSYLFDSYYVLTP